MIRFMNFYPTLPHKIFLPLHFHPKSNVNPMCKPVAVNFHGVLKFNEFSLSASSVCPHVIKAEWWRKFSKSQQDINNWISKCTIAWKLSDDAVTRMCVWSKKVICFLYELWGLIKSQKCRTLVKLLLSCSAFSSTNSHRNTTWHFGVLFNFFFTYVCVRKSWNIPEINHACFIMDIEIFWDLLKEKFF